jgi:uncharacterized protein YbaA (DUF1428 family)
MSYVDGFLLVVPKKNTAAYKKMAMEGAKSWMKHGAVAYFECIGDDMNPSMGGHKPTTFMQIVKPKPSETI